MNDRIFDAEQDCPLSLEELKRRHYQLNSIFDDTDRLNQLKKESRHLRLGPWKIKMRAGRFGKSQDVIQKNLSPSKFNSTTNFHSTADSNLRHCISSSKLSRRETEAESYSVDSLLDETLPCETNPSDSNKLAVDGNVDDVDVDGTLHQTSSSSLDLNDLLDKIHGNLQAIWDELNILALEHPSESNEQVIVASDYDVEGTLHQASTSLWYLDNVLVKIHSNIQAIRNDSNVLAWNLETAHFNLRSSNSNVRRQRGVME